MSYTYDAAGRRTSLTVLGQPTVSYAHDNADRLVQITQGTATVSFTYDNANRRTSLTLPNGVSTEYAYDAASRLTGLTYKLNGTTLGTLTYAYDTAGNRTAIGGTWARTGLPAALTTATYDAANRQLTRDAIAHAFDLNGNLTSDGALTYAWDVRNRLVGLSGSATASFQYDALGRRTAKTINGAQTGFVHEGLNPVQELTNSTPTATLLTGLGIDEYLTRTDATTTWTYLADALGSTVALTDTAGTVQASYTYQPFGASTTTGTPGSNAFEYTGRETDGIGLMYYRARYYHPELARFISEDPAHFNAGDPNLYAYVFNRPTVFVDPLGLEYKDLNITVGFGVGVTFGVLVEGTKSYPYVGGGLMTPGIGASLTASPSSVTEGWQVGLQGAAGVAGQAGYSFGSGGGWFWEAGIGGGWPTFAGASLTGYYVFGPVSSNRARAVTVGLQPSTALSSPLRTSGQDPLMPPRMSGRK